MTAAQLEAGERPGQRHSFCSMSNLGNKNSRARIECLENGHLTYNQDMNSIKLSLAIKRRRPGQPEANKDFLINTDPNSAETKL